MIVVDASAVLDMLLRTPAARALEKWLFDPEQTLHAPHLLDVEVAQVIRRYAARGEIDNDRGRAALANLADLPCTDIRMTSFCRVSGTCGTISRPTTPFTSLLLRRSTLRCSRATVILPQQRVIVRG